MGFDHSVSIDKRQSFQALDDPQQSWQAKNVKAIGKASAACQSSYPVWILDIQVI